jgi:transglutaminase-like putative cysteine protease
MNRLFPLRRRAALWAALLFAIACPAARAKPNFTVQPPPAWVQPVAPPADAGRNEPENGLRCMLDDRQTRVTARGSENYTHYVQQVTTSAAVERVSQLQLEFEPSYQALVIHHVNVVRAGQTINALRPSEIKVIQREGELDERLFNGTLSAVVVINDVRPGDTLDYAYSVNGDNPVLAGNYADVVGLAHPDTCALLRARLLWPSARRLFVRPHQTDLQPAVTRGPDEVEYVWERRNAPGVEYEGSTPDWYDPTPFVQLSEFETWGEVARWAAPLYAPGELSPALRSQIEEWRGLPGAEERLLAARRFVQDEVRYLGIELGTYSHTPTRPSKVFERRFGDCKDKTLLLATMLNELGIAARPALANTEARRTLDDWQPSPYAFDHVIVRAELAGKTYWIDPTISYQRGTLAGAAPPEYERALVVAPETESLSEIPLPGPAGPTTTVRELYEVAGFDAPVRLTVTSTFRGPDADATRYRVAGQSREDLGKEYVNFYADRDPSIRQDGLPEVADDERANVVTLTEHYTIPSFWKESKRELPARYFGAVLNRPGLARRDSPLGVPFPYNIEQLTEVRLPRRQGVRTGERTVEDDTLRFTTRTEADDNVVRVYYSLVTKRDAVPAAEVEKYLATLDQALDISGYELGQGPGVGAGPAAGPWPAGNPSLGIFYLFVLGGGGLFGLYVWRRRRRYARLAEVYAVSRGLPGSLPETAIRLGAESDIGGYVAGFECPGCGRRACGVASRQGLVYDGRRLVVVHVHCDGCRATQDFYFTLAAETTLTG